MSQMACLRQQTVIDDMPEPPTRWWRDYTPFFLDILLMVAPVGPFLDGN